MGEVSWHSGVFFAGTIFSAAAAYLFKVYLARHLGAESLGIYALGMTIVGLVSVVNALGLPQAAIRFVAVYYATGRLEQLRGFLGRSFLWLLVFNLLLAGAMLVAGPLIAVHFYHTPALSPYIGLFVLIMLSGVLTTFLGHVLGGYKDVARRTVINNFIGSPATMVLTIALVAAGFGLRGYLFAQVVSASLVLLLMMRLVWKLTPAASRNLTAKWPPMEKEVISFSGIALGLALLEFLLSQTDRVMVGYYLTARDVGIYAAAGSLVAFVTIVLRSVNQIFAPTISDLYARGQRELMGRMFQTLTKWILGLTMPLAAVMIIFAAPLMRVFGRDFEAGWPILVIGTLGHLINCGVGSSGTMLFMTGHLKNLVRIQVVTAAILIGLNLLLIPLWGITGAAVAAAVTVVVTNLWYVIEIKRALGLHPYNWSYVRLLLPMATSAALLWLLHAKFSHGGFEWLLIAISAVLAYAVFIGAALLFGLDADDRIIAHAIWARISSVFPKVEADV